MIYIIIPVHNRLSFTIQCITSLNLQAEPQKIIVVDDGSTDGTADYIEANFPSVQVLKGDGNLWWTGAMNMGVEYVLKEAQDDDYILSLNNDLVVGENYLTELLNTAKKYPRAIIGSLTLDIDEKETVCYAGVQWDAYTAKIKSLASKEKLILKDIQKNHEVIESSLLPGRGVLMPVSLFKEIGLYDLKNFPQYMADHDFSLRARKVGYKLLISSRAVIYSHVNETGLNASKPKSGWVYIKSSLTSIKSPVNLTNRWRWAKKHSKSPMIVYFTFDMLRISKSLLVKVLSNK